MIDKWIINFSIEEDKVVSCTVVSFIFFIEYHGKKIIGSNYREIDPWADAIYNGLDLKRKYMTLSCIDDVIKVLATDYRDIDGKSYFEAMNIIGLQEYVI